MLKTRVNPKVRTESARGVRWIGHDQDDGLRCRLEDLGKDLPVDPGVGLEQLGRPAGSLRSVAPSAFSFKPAVIMTSAAPVRSE